MSFEFIVVFLRITLIDIAFAGDNAVVIAMALIVAEVLQVPFLSAVGGILTAAKRLSRLLPDQDIW